MEIDGRLIASASIVSYGGRFGFVGLFIVQPEWRGRGLGAQFWNFFVGELRGRLEPGAGVALDGVFAMQNFYARSGFVFTHRNLRMEGRGSASGEANDVADLDSVSFEQIAAYDQEIFGFGRREFLRRWISPRGGHAVGILRDARLHGMGVIRPCASGFKIGPLFADDEVAAEKIFSALSAKAAGQPLFLDVPENNAAAVALAVRHGMKESFGCARMVMGPPSSTLWARVFGVTTFELG